MSESLDRKIEDWKLEERAEILQKMYGGLAIRIGDKNYIRDYWILYTQLGV